MADSQVVSHDVVVIGGGVAGLYTALKLIDGGVTDVKIFEGRGSLGGRVQTTRTKDGEPLFNDFAWRVGETNTRMLALAKELGIELREQSAPRDVANASVGSHCDASHGACDEPKNKIEIPDHRPPLSVFAEHCLESTATADRVDRESGYAGRTAQIAFPHESHGSKNFVVVNGMNEFVTAIAAKLPAGVINTNHRCKDVTKTDTGYKVEVVKRDGNNYTSLVINATTVVLATPPFSLRQFSVAKDGLNPVLFAIHERRLCHAYVKASGSNVPDSSTDENRIYRSVPDSILQQIISGDYGHNIFQAAYACDRFERVWRELQFLGPETVKKELVSQLSKIENLVPQLNGLTIEEIYIKSGFVHRWHIEAHVCGKTKEELSLQAIYPNPAMLPSLHLVGEAFSAHQGWTEGALQTASDCVDIILAEKKKSKTPMPTVTSKFSQPTAVQKTHMVYKGLVIDVSDWGSRHPGGMGMIKGHSGEDVTEIFENFHAGWPAPLATLFGLQAGYKK